MVGIYGSVNEAKKKSNSNTKMQQDALVKSTLDKIKYKFLIMSGKGGVGKTSTTIGLSLILAGRGYKVGIIDVDLHGPDVPRMLGVGRKLDINSKNKLEPVRFSDNLSLVSVESIMLSRDDAVVWRGPMKYTAIQQFIGNVDWGPLDFLLIDAPPGTGDEPLTIAQSIQDAKAIIVTTPQEISLADVRKSINFCKMVKMEIFGLVENMSNFVCPHCSGEISFFGFGGGEKTALDMGIPFLGQVPFDQKLVISSDSGKLDLKIFLDARFSKIFGEITDKMIEFVKA